MYLPVPRRHYQAAILAVGAVVALTLTLPLAAQVGMFCMNLEPIDEFCNVDDTACADRLRQCDFDFDGQSSTGYEQSAFFFENRGTETNPPFGLGDRRCYQGENFNPGQQAPPDSDINDYGFLRFGLLLPVGYDPEVGGSFPLLVYLRGGGPGWSDSSSGMLNSWSREFDDPNTSRWEKGEYRGQLVMGQRVANDQIILSYILDTDGLAAKVREMGWGILVPSGCSHDQWAGNAALDDDGDPDLIEAANTRYGLDSVKEALEIVTNNYDIHYFFVAGTSGGGVGAFVLSHDLVGFESKFRGVIADAAGLEAVAFASLYDTAANTNGEQDIHINTTCSEPTNATVPCDSANVPMATGFDKTGLKGRSVSEDIQDGTSVVPILHTWNSRDIAHCYDWCYSEEFLHGPIRIEIDARKNDLIEDNFDFSESLEVCAGSCLSIDEVVVTCSRHGNLGEQTGAPTDGVLDCAVDWINAVNGTYDQIPPVPYATPTSCQLSIVDDIDDLNPPACEAQRTLMNLN